MEEKEALEELEGLQIDFRHSISLFPTGEPNDLLIEIHGVISRHYGADPIGEIEGYRLPAFPDTLEAADAYSEDLLECARVLFDEKTGEYREEILERYGEPLNGLQLLILDFVSLALPYRGRRLGLATILRFIDTFEQG